MTKLMIFFTLLFASEAPNQITFFDESKTYEGRVLFFKSEFDYGYILESTSESEVLVHSLDVIDELHNNDRVTFRIINSVKGPRAYDVQIIQP